MNEPHVVRVATVGGRQLAGKVFGSVRGEPFLFIAGAATGKSMCFGGGLLDAAGARMLTMDRPGMGESTLDPRRTLQSTVRDYAAFVRAVAGVSFVPVVSHSQGSVFGLEAAAQGLASRLVLVSPADEVARRDIRAMVPAGAARLVDLIEQEPERAAALLGAFDPGSMESMVMEGASENDRRTYSAPAFLSRYRRALIEGFASAGAGYVRDTLIAMSSWGVALGDIHCPTDVLVGAHDHGHSPDQARMLTERIPGARRHVFEDGGGALLWTHSQEVLASVSGGVG